MRIKWWLITSFVAMLFCAGNLAQAQLPNALFDRAARFDDITSQRPHASRSRRSIRVAQQADLFHETETFESVNRFHAQKQISSIKSQLPKPDSQHKSLLTRPIAKPRFTRPTGTSFTPTKVPDPSELSKLEFSDSPKTPQSRSNVSEAKGLFISTFELKKGMQRESTNPSSISEPAAKPKSSYTSEAAKSSPLDFDVSKPVAIEGSDFPVRGGGLPAFQTNASPPSDFRTDFDESVETNAEQVGPYSLVPPESGKRELLPEPQAYSGKRFDADTRFEDSAGFHLEPEPALPDFGRDSQSEAVVHSPMDGVSQDLPWTAYSENQAAMGPSEASSDLLYGGYGGMVDSYVNQLLAGGGNNTYSAVSDFGPTWTSPDGGGCGSMFIAPSGWYADIKALVLNPTTRGTVDVSRDGFGHVALKTSDLDIGWSTGVDARLGFRTGASAVEFGWWSLFPASDVAEVSRPAGDLLPVINLDFPSAELHRMENQLEVHSIDVRHVLMNSRSSQLSLGVWWGLRFTRIREEFRFESDRILAISGDEARYDLEVDNRMIGPQFGGIGYWQVASRLGLRAEAQIGAYYNYISQHHRAGNDIGPFPFAAGPDAGQPFDVGQSTSTASAISEFNVGLEYQLRPRLRLLGGYRLVAAAGIARTISQIPNQFGPVYDFSIDARDSLILHGFEFGVDFTF